MTRGKKPDKDLNAVARLRYIKSLVARTKGALPNADAELRREACEEIDDLIRDLA